MQATISRVSARRTTRAFATFAFATAVALSACSNKAVDTTDPNPPAAVAGTFAGAYTNQRSPGNYTATIALTQTGHSLTGTFTSTDTHAQATVNGNIDNVRITATFQSTGTCPSTITAVIDVISNATVLVGTYTAQDCIGSYTGAFSLTKQP